MNSESLSINEKISIIEQNKHDVTMLICGTLLDPIEYMDSPQAASAVYFKDKSEVHNEIKNLAKDVASFLTQKWRDVHTTEEDQLLQIKRNLTELNTDIIPKINTIISHYNDCLNKLVYFNLDDKAGVKARVKMEHATKRVSHIIKKLEALNYAKHQSISNIESYFLLELLQEVLDGIDADILYESEEEIYTYKITTDKEMLQDRVLLNIANNITRHAFGTDQFRKKRFWEKKVRVILSTVQNQYYIYISNNGAPFRGSVSKVFDLGYTSGKKQNDGYGMYNAKKYIEELGGSIEFITRQDDDFKVTVILKLPINNTSVNF